MKVCPECAKEYPSEWVYCKVDGAELITKADSSEPSKLPAPHFAFMAELPDPEELDREDSTEPRLRFPGSMVGLCTAVLIVGVGTYAIRSWQLQQRDRPQRVVAEVSSPSGDEATPEPAVTVQTVPSTSYPGERFPQTREQVLTSQEIANWDFAAVRYAINEIYARHGYAFKDPDIRRRFKTFDWYKAEPGMTMEHMESKRLSQVELANAKLLSDRRQALQSQGHGE
jgi:YARHG domain